VSLAAATRYPVTGIVLKVDRPHRSFDASCAAIPGYMEAMAMPYSVLDNRELADLKPGAYVDFTLVVEKERSYAEGIHIHRYEMSGVARAGYDPSNGLPDGMVRKGGEGNP
jgi:Cu/Ag efflux protein CusF